MSSVPDSFEFDYFGSDIVYGRRRVDRLESFLAERELRDALVVCGRHVGGNDALMNPVREGLGERLAGVFDETTPAKTAETVYDGIEAMEAADADVLVGVGGGSSLDVARQMSAFAADGRPLSAFREAARNGRADSPAVGDSPTPVVVVPTTLAGAGISDGGSIRVLTAEESPTDETVRVGGAVMPAGMFYDPALFETTPTDVLARSSMNGFDKGIETVYARDGSPVTDGTAVHSLRLFREALPRLRDGDAEAVDRAVVAIVLAQFRRRASVIHSFGHGFSRHYPVHQGTIHGIVAPHVLRYLFREVDAGRSLLAEGLGADPTNLSDEERAEAVVDVVVEIRDGLGQPSRLRGIDELEADHLPDVAEYILEDTMMAQAPAALDPTAEEIEAVLREAW